MEIAFHKYSAQGNDFLIIDNRDQKYDGSDSKLWSAVCQRRCGVGADGVILFESSTEADFRMRYIDSDGGQSELCANGGRSILHYAYHVIGLKQDSFKIQTKEGIYGGRVLDNDEFLLELNAPTDEGKYDLSKFLEFERSFYINTGVPHALFVVDELDQIDVNHKGKLIRYDCIFQNGSNVNFIKPVNANKIQMRTYERGVESETLACGTGACAAAIYMVKKQNAKGLIEVHMPGGVLKVDTSQGLDKLTIQGPVKVTYCGSFSASNFATK